MEVQHQQTPPLGVFWDIENCQVPSGKSALSVCDKIRQQSFCLNHSERQFAVVCDVTKENRQVLEELDKAQVDIFHVPANRKNAVDFKIKTLMRRFADTHRDGARIVLISGDSDFAGDIADFKRRMCLSVILLHTNQCSESLKLAATSVYNFQNLMSCIEIRQDLLRLQCLQVNDQLEISNLPDPSNCSREQIHSILTQLAAPYNGRVTEILPSRGTASIKFEREQEANNFKRKNLSYEIRNRPIKIHFSNSVHRRNRSQSRGKSVSRAVVRTRTKSESGQARHSSGDSLESPASDTVEDPRVVKSEPRALDLSQSLQGLGLTSRLAGLTGSSGGEETGGEGGPGSNRPRRMHAKMKSKLKLKNRKKSEATPGFRNKTEIDGDEEDYETDDSDQFSPQIRTNITSLIDQHQLVRLKLLNHFYLERYQSDLVSPVPAPSRLGRLISRQCRNLIIISFNKELHVVTKNGTFVLSYLARLHQVLYNSLKRNNFCPVQVNDFEESYRREYGEETFLDLELAARQCPGLCFVRHQDLEFIDLTPHFRLGNELVEIVRSRGGVVSLDSLLGAYNSVTGRNIDPTSYGFSSLEQLISSYHLLLSLRGRSTVVLRSLSQQLISGRAEPQPDLVSQADGVRLLSLACNHGPPPGSSVVSPALRSVRQEGMFKSGRLSLTGCISQARPHNTMEGEVEEEEEEVDQGELVMLGSSGDIVTVETDTSDAESVLARERGRKKSRMAASLTLQ